jgi:hypothetical protein
MTTVEKEFIENEGDYFLYGKLIVLGRLMVSKSNEGYHQIVIKGIKWCHKVFGYGMLIHDDFLIFIPRTTSRIHIMIFKLDDIPTDINQVFNYTNVVDSVITNIECDSNFCYFTIRGIRHFYKIPTSVFGELLMSFSDPDNIPEVSLSNKLVSMSTMIETIIPVHRLKSIGYQSDIKTSSGIFNSSGNPISGYNGQGMMNPYRQAFIFYENFRVDLDHIGLKFTITFYGMESYKEPLSIVQIRKDKHIDVSMESISWISHDVFVFSLDDDIHLFNIDRSSIISEIFMEPRRREYTMIDLTEKLTLSDDFNMIPDGMYYIITTNDDNKHMVISDLDVLFENDWLKTSHVRLAYSRRAKMTDEPEGFLSLHKPPMNRIFDFL